VARAILNSRLSAALRRHRVFALISPLREIQTRLSPIISRPISMFVR
jgi:hypothetical protein